MAYIGQAPSTIVSENTFDEFNFTATSNQTTFTGVDSDGKTLEYNPGNMEVFLNGVRLEEADFTATNGTSVVLAIGATTGDVMSVKSFAVFEVGDAVSKASGGAFGGNVSVTGTVTATSYSGDGSNLSGISTDLVLDITPQLGGNLDGQAFNITTTGTIVSNGLTVDTNTLHVDSSNNRIGIGTTSPSQKLHLGGTASMDSIIRQDATTSGTNWEIGERVAGKYQFWEDDNDSVVMTLMSTGNVGIGTASPDQKMHLYTGAGTTLYKAEVNANSTVGLEIKKTGSTTQSWRIVDGETINGALQFYDVTDSRVSLQIDGDGVVKTGGRGLTIDNSAAAWTAVNVTEASNANMALLVKPHREARTKGFSMGSMGQGNQSGLQTFDTSDNTANDFLINPYGGVVGVGASGNLSAKFTVNKPATGHSTGYQEDIAQLYTTETTYLGRHYMNFFHDNNNRDTSGDHTVWGMAFGYDNNTRGGIQYDHKGNERMTLWSSYGSMQFKIPATPAATKLAHQITDDPALELKSNGNNLRPRQSGICLTLPSSQTWASGNNWVKVNLTTVVYQKGNTSAWDSGNGRYTCPETGLYLCTTSVQMENNGGSVWRYFFPCINGATNASNGMNFADFVPQDSPNATYYHHTHSCILKCSSGDYIEWKMTGSGGGHTVKGGVETACAIYFLG